MSLSAECLAATTGLWPTKEHPSESDRLAAYGLLDRWRSKLTKWLRHPEEVAPFEWVEPPDQDDLREKILRPIEQDEAERLIVSTGDVDLGREYVDVITAGRNFLNTKWPKRPVPGMSVELFPISDDDLANVWNLTRILDDDGALLDEIAAYSVTVDMINAWKMVFPELSNEVLKILQGDGVSDYGLLVDHHAVGKKLSWQQESVLDMLIGKPREAVPQGQQKEQEKPKENPKSGDSKAENQATKADFRP